MVKNGIKILTFVGFWLISGCDTLETLSLKPSDNRIKSVHLRATEDINQSSAIAVDIVFIFNETLQTQLDSYSAKNWFTERNRFQVQYPNEFAIFSYELVPLTQQVFIPKKQKASFPKPHHKAKRIMIFANYLLDEPHFSADITCFTKPVITLHKAHISVVESSE